MRSGLDAITILYQQGQGSALQAAVVATGGSLFLMKRPIRPRNSLIEDIVFNSLPTSGDQIQRNTSNINIHVPDIRINVGASQEIWPNTARLKQLTDLAIGLYGERYAGDYTYWITSIQTIEESEINSHYVNIRVDFQFLPNA